MFPSYTYQQLCDQHRCVCVVVHKTWSLWTVLMGFPGCKKPSFPNKTLMRRCRSFNWKSLRRNWWLYKGLPPPGVGMGDGMLTTPVPVFCSNQKSFPKTREMYYMIFVAVILRNKPNVCDAGCMWGSPFFSLYLHSILREMDFKPQNDCPQTPCPGELFGRRRHLK